MAPPAPRTPQAIPDPLDDPRGFAAHVTAAPVRRVARSELDGHVALGSRELHELGCTVAPIGWRHAPAAVVGRLQVVAGVLLACVGIAGALVPTLTPLFELLGGSFADPAPNDSELHVAVGAIFAAFGLGGATVARRGVRRVRTGVEARRTADGDPAVPAADDPRARATVAVRVGPREHVATLLWLRGDPSDPGRVEVRTLAETHVDADDVAGAEDAVVRLSEIVLRADAAAGLRADGSAGRRAGRRAIPAPADGSGAARSSARSLVAATGDVLPAVDPAVPVAADWAPDPLDDAGRAELAARLVRARPRLWNAAQLERLVTDPDRSPAPAPPAWPDAADRRARSPVGLPTAWRHGLRNVAAGAAATWVVAIAAADGSANPTPARIVGYGALGVAVAAVVGLRVALRRAPGRRLLRAVRAAARGDGDGLAGGVPGPAGRFLVLRGVDDGQDRIELVHARVRPSPADDRVELRTLAVRTRRTDDVVTADEVTRDVLRVADAAAYVATGRARDVRGLRRLNRALARATAERRALQLYREPLAWAAGATAAVVIVAAARHLLGVTDDPLEHGLGNRILSFAWPLSAIVLLAWTARLVRDPYRDD